MLIFEAAAAGDAFALADVDTKPQLPFEEMLVVAGRLPPLPLGASARPRQLTGVGGRARADGKRRVAVFPLLSGADGGRVQVLDAGEGAALFLQDARACFPSLVKRSPLALAGDDEDDEDDSDASDSEGGGSKAQQEKRKGEQEPAPAVSTETLDFMQHSRVKVLPSLAEVLAAYSVENAAQVAAAAAHDRELSASSHLLCLELPPAPPGPATTLNFAVLFCHETEGGKRSALLQIPVPRSLRLNGDARLGMEEDESFQDATVLSFGAHREATRHGGGKSSAEMVQNIRMRHASGTFCTLVLPTTDWPSVAARHAPTLPVVRELCGELRLRRILGPAANAEPVELQLEA